MTFDEWLDEIEGFSLRRERLYDDLEGFKNGDSQTHVMNWLRAAYDVGAEHSNATWQEIVRNENTITQKYKDGYDAAMRILKSTYPDKFPDAYFISGEGGKKDENGLPKQIYVCPAYGVDWFQIYERTDKTHGPEY